MLPTGEVLTDCAVAVTNGALSFRFTRLLNSSTLAVPLSRNDSLPLIWALFPAWEVQDAATGHPLERNIHPNFAFDVVYVRLTGGNFPPSAHAAATSPRRRVARAIVAHAALMALAWGVLFPGGALAMRHAKHLQLLRQRNAGDVFRLHVAASVAGMALMAVAFGLSVQHVRVQQMAHFSSLHARCGLALFILAWLQPLNGLARPPAGAAEARSAARRAWELAHAWFGRALIAAGLLLVLSGINRATAGGGADGVRRAGQAVWVMWCVLSLGGAAVAAEVAARRRRQAAETGAGWVSMNDLQ